MDIVIRAAVVFVFVWLVLRALGKRELGELTAFELVLLFVIGDLVQQSITQNDTSITAAFLAISTIALLIVAQSYAVFRWKRSRKVLEGEPVVVVHEGRFIGPIMAYAVALQGTIPIRLPFWPTTECQVSMSFANLAVPAVGGYATQIRFLQKQGVDLASAVASGGLLSNVAGIFSQVLLFFVAIALAPDSLDLGNVNVNEVIKVIVLILLVALAAVGVILGVGKLRRAVVPPVMQAMRTIREALRSPKRIMAGGLNESRYTNRFGTDALGAA